MFAFKAPEIYSYKWMPVFKMYGVIDASENPICFCPQENGAWMVTTALNMLLKILGDRLLAYLPVDRN